MAYLFDDLRPERTLPLFDRRSQTGYLSISRSRYPLLFYGEGGRGSPVDPEKELSFQGVYMLSAGGKLTVVDDKLSRPNGIGLSPDEKTLYVSNSGAENPVWKRRTHDQGM